MSSPKLSFIILAYDMQREFPKTLQSLTDAYQKNIPQGEFEIILIENRSKNLLNIRELKDACPNLRYYLNSSNPSSPAYAMNLGLKKAKGDTVAFCIDGARMLSPGVAKGIIQASKMYDDFVVATHAYHLGMEPQNLSVPAGRYNQSIEDGLLEKIDWPKDGYKLFDISVLALSSSKGWFGEIAESNCIALPKASAIKLGGFDENFTTLGGGYVNLDFYKRAQELTNHQLIYLLGEGTFHQVHGGVATNRDDTPHDEYKKEYSRLRGESFKVKRLPQNVMYLGSIHPSAKKVLLESANKIFEDVD
ncbi:glycosyltransferase [uncultured Cocleimonas sp.]|uniref:glycosyltransferase n=1 Tax=uncultured Cocleimonas sp. TaxID=1051587 RepID=UPI0026121698|nr:glycosyltransferase [uncultured Cocleimonas sp.]